MDFEVCLGIPSCVTRWVPRGSRGLILGSTGRGRPILGSTGRGAPPFVSRQCFPNSSMCIYNFWNMRNIDKNGLIPPHSTKKIVNLMYVKGLIMSYILNHHLTSRYVETYEDRIWGKPPNQRNREAWRKFIIILRKYGYKTRDYWSSLRWMDSEKIQFR